jgi:3-hydroxybutyryl-CoA dehydrogenase
MNVNDIKKVAIIGAGTMGAGFGVCFARAGLETRLFDVSPDQLTVGMERIKKVLDMYLAEGLITPEQAEAIPGLISTYTDRAQALDGVQFVLEAIPENLALKQKVFAEMESEVAPDTILASNTSALYVTEIARDCTRPELVCGMHWWNPPELVPLVEVIKGEKTSEATARLVYELVEKADRVPIMVNKEAPGFVGNRMQLALFREAMHIVEQGIASPEDVDRAVKHALGFRWAFIGPLETADLGNLDTWNRVASYLFPFLADNKEAPARLKELAEAGHLGVQSGKGFYEYSPEGAAEAVRKRDLYFLKSRKLAKEVSES